jgi:hypothetical protein
MMTEKKDAEVLTELADLLTGKIKNNGVCRVNNCPWVCSNKGKVSKGPIVCGCE